MSTSASPPPRPEKSKFRNISPSSSKNLLPPLNLEYDPKGPKKTSAETIESPISPLNASTYPSSKQISVVSLSVPEKTPTQLDIDIDKIRHSGRFKEEFDQVPSLELLEQLLNSSSVKPSKKPWRPKKRSKSRSHTLQASSSTSTVDTSGSFGPPLSGTPVLESPSTPTTSFQKSSNSYFPLFSAGPAAFISGRKTSLSNEILSTPPASKLDTLATLVDTDPQYAASSSDSDKLKRKPSVTANTISLAPTKPNPPSIISTNQTESKIQRELLPRTDNNTNILHSPVPPTQLRKPAHNTTTTTGTNRGSNSQTVQDISLNRADVIITRLENWLFIIKAIGAWLEETAKINVQSSRSFQQQSLSLLREDYIGQKEPANAIATFYTGLRELAVNVIQEQRDFSEHMFVDHIPVLMKLRKECKDKIRELKENEELAMDELLKRAEVTMKTMTHLNRCCMGMERETGDGQRLQQLQDPWVANLYVLRQLKKEVDEENRLRVLMVGVQKDTSEFERKIIQSLKTSIKFCYENIPPGLSENSSDKDNTQFKALLTSTPEEEWVQFMENNKKDLVNEQFPTKDYLNINFKNKHNPYVLTLMKGKAERRTGVRKQFVEKYFVLSQCGFLHQFSLSDKVAPERFIYIPNSVIVPSIDINQLVNESNVSEEMASNEADQNYTFEIRRPSTTVLQRDKAYQFRVSSRQDLLSWCKALVEVAGRSYMAQYLVSSRSSLGMNRDSSSISAEEKSPSENNLATGSTEMPSRSSLDNEARIEHNDSTFSFSYTVQSGSTNSSSKLTESNTRDILPLENMTPVTVPSDELDNNYSSVAKTLGADEDDHDQRSTNDLEEDTVNEMAQEYHAPQDSGDEDTDSISLRSTCTARQSLNTAVDILELLDDNDEAGQTADPRRLSGESVLIDDAASSLYFSSTSGPNSPSGSVFSIDSYPEIDISAYLLPALETQHGHL
ncbi:hypothetical protein CLU79DRAFT_741827 [Phycomyces nitens]|nr:hypothetical protein CLU79DRAFT_741827 [Phycomyces nitens]